MFRLSAIVTRIRCSLDDRNKSSISSCLREFAQLSGMQKPSNEDYVTAVKAVAQFFDGPTIFLKGVRDIVSTAAVSLVVDRGNRVSPRRCGGQGDLLAGSLATTINWATKVIMPCVEKLHFLRQ